MSDVAALKVAVDLLHVPSRVRPVRAAALPEGVAVLLQIAAGDEEALRWGTGQSGRSANVVREAATFFIEQILLAPDADSYRVLGSTADAPGSELRRNMALLLKWLHPDLERHGNGGTDRSVFAGRVTQAWEDLKTAERRAAYDASRQSARAKPKRRRGRGRRPAGPAGAKARASGGLWRALLSLFGAPRH